MTDIRAERSAFRIADIADKVEGSPPPFFGGAIENHNQLILLLENA